MKLPDVSYLAKKLSDMVTAFAEGWTAETTVSPLKLAVDENNPLTYTPPWSSNSISMAWSDPAPPAVVTQIGLPCGSNFEMKMSLELPLKVVFFSVAVTSKLPAMYLLPKASDFTALMETW